jgi:hypothetical protein
LLFSAKLHYNTNMKKIIYVLILPLLVVSWLLFANQDNKTESSKSSIPKPITAAEKKAAMEKWEASPEGIAHKKWEASPAGKKVHESAAKISKSIRNYTNMEGVITSLSLPPGSRLGYGVMVRILGDDYILTFRIERSDKNDSNFTNVLEQLHSLKVNDKIIIKSQNMSKAPKYSYLIVTCDYLERDGKIIYKRAPQKGGC